MRRSSRTTLFALAALAAACNAVFDLEPTRRRGDAGAAGDGRAGGANGAGGDARAGAAGEPGAAGGGATAGAAGTPNAAGAAGETGAAGAAGDGGGAAGAAGDGGGTQGGAGAAGGPPACGPPAAFTPKACSGNSCSSKDVTCDAPANGACEFRCLGNRSCQGSTIHCPAQGDCRVVCGDTLACENTTVVCGSGYCEVVCQGAADSCQNIHRLDCAPAATCLLTCEPGTINVPDIDCSGHAGDCLCDDSSCTAARTRAPAARRGRAAFSVN